MASKNRLDQAAGESIGGFFSKANESKLEQTDNNTERPPKLKKEPTKSTKAGEKADIKQKKQVFSFRAMLKDIASWKAYATATGQTMENIGTAAMNEYLNRHKLTGAEQTIYEAMKTKSKK